MINEPGYSNMDGKENKCKKYLPLIFVSILVLIIVGLVALIVVTYSNDLQCGSSESEKRSKRDHVSFLMFSDVHLDTFYKPTAAKSGFCRNESIVSPYIAKYGRIGCDSPMNLYQSVLNAMKNKSMDQQKVDFILSTGDTAAHGITLDRRPIILEIMRNSSNAVSSVFPSIPYFPLVGNNDLPGHYIMPTENDKWYRDLLEIWKDGILCTKCNQRFPTTTKDELEKTFLKGGYYKVNIVDGKVVLLVLNSMYWTKSTWRREPYFSEIAEGQMAWLKEELGNAQQQGKKVFIASHIPPGIDSYSKTDVYSTLWFSNFTQIYVDLVANNFSDTIAGQFYAHFHKDSFRVIHDEKGDPKLQKSSFILLNPSVSTVYKNNPGFRIAHVDPKQGLLTDYEQYYMNIVMATQFDNPVWHLDYKFSTKYPSEGTGNDVINGNRIKLLSDGLINQTDDGIFDGYIRSRQVRYQPDEFSRFIYYCAVRFLKQDDFNECQKRFKVPGG